MPCNCKKKGNTKPVNTNTSNTTVTTINTTTNK